ncbi:MAG: thiolase [Actinomycetia bacterium]|nr:thiolase [Actinomycetes bacterium]
MKPGSVAVVGAAESTEMGRVPGQSVIGIHADAALNAFADCGITGKDIDGVATAGMRPTDLAHYLGIVPTWVDGTAVGGCSFMLHVRHAAAAINDGLCTTVLITHGESGRSRVGVDPFSASPASLAGQFEAPYGPMGPTTLFTIPWLRYAKTYGVGNEALADVAVAQRQWASRNPRATLQDLTTVDEVMNDRVIAWPFTKAMCCLVTDGGGALIVTSADRVDEFDSTPAYVLGTGESVETPMISQMADFTSSRAFRVSGPRAFGEAGISHDDVDHLMIYDAFAHLPLYGLEDLGFVGPGEAPAFIADGNTGAGGQLPLNTNGGGLSYMHSGMYGMYALQESVRQIRCVAPAQVDDVQIAVSHGVGGMFGAAGTIVFGRHRN